MAASAPVIKLASLLIRTLAKPVANKMKKEAGNHPAFSSLCVYVGQKLHFVTSNINVLAMGYKIVAVKPLPKEDALQKGVNFLSEFFIFTVAGTVVVIETLRSEHKSALKSAAAQEKELQKEAEIARRFAEIDELLQDIEDSLPPVAKTKLANIRNAKENGKLIVMSTKSDTAPPAPPILPAPTATDAAERRELSTKAKAKTESVHDQNRPPISCRNSGESPSSQNVCVSTPTGDVNGGVPASSCVTEDPDDGRNDKDPTVWWASTIGRYFGFSTRDSEK